MPEKPTNVHENSCKPSLKFCFSVTPSRAVILVLTPAPNRHLSRVQPPSRLQLDLDSNRSIAYFPYSSKYWSSTRTRPWSRLYHITKVMISRCLQLNTDFALLGAFMYTFPMQSHLTACRPAHNVYRGYIVDFT